MISSTTLSWIAAAVLALCWISNRLLVPRPLAGIPYSRISRWMPWGDLASLGVHSLRTGSTFDWLSRQCLKHKSPIVQIMIPSFSTTSPVLLIADLYEVKDIIVNRCREIDRASLIHYWFEVVVPLATTSMQTTKSFKRQRRLWNVMLNPDFLENVATPAFEKTINDAIILWTLKSKMAAQSTFVVYEDLRRTMLEGIWKVLIGKELGLVDASISEIQRRKHKGQYSSVDTGTIPATLFPHFFSDFKTLITGMDWVVQGISPRVYKWIFNRLPHFNKSMHRMKSMLQDFITETRSNVLNSTPTQRCGLSDVLRQKDEGVSDASMIDEILELFITGHETTASTTAWGLKYLADHQYVQKRLYECLRHAFPNATASNLPRGTEISQAHVPYLDAVLAEILRMAGTGPVLFRETLVDCEIMGHAIPAKTPVFLATQSPPGPDMISPTTFKDTEALNEKPKPWDESFDTFIPERWLDKEGKFNADAGLSLPFSTGKRGCFGKRIAMLELRLVISMMVLSFHFQELPKELTKFNSRDGLTRQPACSYIRPNPR